MIHYYRSSPARVSSSPRRSATGAPTRSCKAEDIGLQPDDVSDRLISLGHKRLLPREATAALSLVESRAHALIEANTFPFLNGLAHFLPNTKLQEVTDKLKELEGEFWAGQSQVPGTVRLAPGSCPQGMAHHGTEAVRRPGTRSGHDRSVISASRDIGAVLRFRHAPVPDLRPGTAGAGSGHASAIRRT